MSKSVTIKLVRRLGMMRSTAPAWSGGYRKLLLGAHESLLQELTTLKPGNTPVEI